MKIYYNNKLYELEDGLTILEVIESIEVIEHKAVWLNGKHVALSDFKRLVKDGDHLKIVRIRGGG